MLKKTKIPPRLSSPFNEIYNKFNRIKPATETTAQKLEKIN